MLRLYTSGFVGLPWLQVRSVQDASSWTEDVDNTKVIESWASHSVHRSFQMSAVAGAGSPHVCRRGDATSKFASAARVAPPVCAARADRELPTPMQRRFLPGTREGFLAEQVDDVGKQGKQGAYLGPSPPPAPRLRPSPGKTVVPFLALESEDESEEEEEDLTPKCPAAPRLGPKADPPLAAGMPELILPLPIISVGADAWDEGVGFVLSGSGEEDSEADGGNGSIDANTWTRMVSANASTACADDLEDRCPSPGLRDILCDNKLGENQFRR